MLKSTSRFRVFGPPLDAAQNMFRQSHATEDRTKMAPTVCHRGIPDPRGREKVRHQCGKRSRKGPYGPSWTGRVRLDPSDLRSQEIKKCFAFPFFLEFGEKIPNGNPQIFCHYDLLTTQCIGPVRYRSTPPEDVGEMADKPENLDARRSSCRLAAGPTDLPDAFTEEAGTTAASVVGNTLVVAVCRWPSP